MLRGVPPPEKLSDSAIEIRNYDDRGGYLYIMRSLEAGGQ